MSKPGYAKGSMTAQSMRKRVVRSKQGQGGLDQESDTHGPLRVTELVAETELRHAPNVEPLSLTGGVWRQQVATIAAVSAGGFLGANARYLVGLWAADRFGTTFPWGTLLINVSGSFVLGFYLTLVTERFVGRSTTRLFLATGVLGAYTTFSTLSYETVQLVAAGAALPALGYVAGSLLLGIAAAVAGILIAHAL